MALFYSKLRTLSPAAFFLNFGIFAEFIKSKIRKKRLVLTFLIKNLASASLEKSIFSVRRFSDFFARDGLFEVDLTGRAEFRFSKRVPHLVCVPFEFWRHRRLTSAFSTQLPGIRDFAEKN
jgi:hypothetical protein